MSRAEEQAQAVADAMLDIGSVERQVRRLAADVDKVVARMDGLESRMDVYESAEALEARLAALEKAHAALYGTVDQQSKELLETVQKCNQIEFFLRSRMSRQMPA